MFLSEECRNQNTSCKYKIKVEEHKRNKRESYWSCASKNQAAQGGKLHITQCLITTLRSEARVNIVKNFFGHLCPVLFLKVSCTAGRGRRLPVAEMCIKHLSLPVQSAPISLCRKTLGLFGILCKAFQNQGHGTYMYLHTHPRGRLEWVHCNADPWVQLPLTDLPLDAVPTSTYACTFVFWTFSL